MKKLIFLINVFLFTAIIGFTQENPWRDLLLISRTETWKYQKIAFLVMRTELFFYLGERAGNFSIAEQEDTEKYLENRRAKGLLLFRFVLSDLTALTHLMQKDKPLITMIRLTQWSIFYTCWLVIRKALKRESI